MEWDDWYAYSAFALYFSAAFFPSGDCKGGIIPGGDRALGVGLPYALTVAIFGGTAEYIALWFKEAGHESWFYWYITGCIAISLLVYLFVKGSRQASKLNEDS